MNWAVFMAGVIIGSILTNVIILAQSATGKFRVDHSNPQKDVYRVEIDNLDIIDKKSRMYLKIDHNADLSQE